MQTVYFNSGLSTYYMKANIDRLGRIFGIHRDLVLYSDYIWTKNQYGHWYFIKNRYNGDLETEYFELKDLLNSIPINPLTQDRKYLNRCKHIKSHLQIEDIIKELTSKY